jgi:hypothetical protein
MEPRTITLPVTFRVGSLRTLGLAGGPQQVWATADRRGRRYELTIGDVGDTKMAARARHGDRRLNAHADLAPFVEALFDKLAELLEEPVLACCDQPHIAPGGVCEHCRTRLSDDQVLALVDCGHPTLEGVPTSDRDPCPDCGLAWCRAQGAARLEGGRVVAADDPGPCTRAATAKASDGTTLCGYHQDPTLSVLQIAEHWTRSKQGKD